MTYDQAPSGAPRFCGACGGQVAAGTRPAFCVECGTPLAPAPVPPAVAPAQTYAAAAPAPAPAWMRPATDPFGSSAPRPRRRGRVVVATLAVLAVLGGGAAAAVLVLGGGYDGPVDAYGTRLVAPVEQAPGVAWTYELPGEDSVDGIAVGGGMVVVGGGPRGLVALDTEDGSERWTSSDAYPIVTSNEGDQVLALADEDLVALAADDGEEQWRVPGVVTALYAGSEVLVLTETRIAMVDDRTGEQEWSLPRGDSVDVNLEVLVTVSDGFLRATDLQDGEELWSEPVDGEDLSMSLVDKMVVVAEGSVVTSYDSTDGQVLWTDDDGQGTVTVSSFGARRVAVVDGFSDTSARTAEVFNISGSVGNVDLVDSYLVGRTVGAPADDFTLTSDGRIYAGTGELVTEVGDTVAPVDGGLYVVDDSAQISFLRLPSSEPVWSVPLPEDVSDPTLAAVDDGLVVTSGSTVTGYR